MKSAPSAAGEFKRVRGSSWTLAYSFGFTALAILFLLAVAGLFLWQSVPVWRHEGYHYLSGTRWFYRDHQFGSLPLLYGSAVVSSIALLLAAPLGIGAGIFTSEYLPPRLRLGVKIAVELLAGIPSVVYGLLGILFLRNWVYRMLTPFDPLSGDTLLTAGLLLAVMVLPTVMTLSDDAFRAVPTAQRAAARGLGLTRTESVFFISMPQAAPGVFAAVLLGLGRAFGETIAVFLVVGRQDNQWTRNLLSLQPWIRAGQTLTSKLGGSEVNIAYGEPRHWAAIVGLGLILLVVVAAITVVGAQLARRSSRHA